jgi:hypothetical protein
MHMGCIVGPGPFVLHVFDGACGTAGWAAFGGVTGPEARMA